MSWIEESEIVRKGIPLLIRFGDDEEGDERVGADGTGRL